MPITPGFTDFRMQYEISPIYLTGGAASGIGGGWLPLISLTQGNIFTSLTSGGADLSLDDFFARWMPLSGGSLVKQRIGQYPFANQATAANAVIRDPIDIPMLMVCPANTAGSLSEKQAVLSAMKATIDQHNNSGGTYSINTPAFLYTDCVLLGIEDTSQGPTANRVQFQWVWRFHKPLITQADAVGAYNNLMGKIANGNQINADASGSVGDWSSRDNAIGNAAGGEAGATVPAAYTGQGLSYSSGDFAFSTTAGTSIPPGGIPVDTFTPTTGFVPF